MRIGVLTSGGDCPGLNAVIRSVVHRAVVDHGDEVIGFRDGWKGLLECDYLKLDLDAVSGILARGGTVLGSSRVQPEHLRDGVERARGHVEDLGLDAIIPIGGEGTLKAARLLSDNGLPIVGVPKTIDNDIAVTDVTFGFDTAVGVATEALDRLKTTAESHELDILATAIKQPLVFVEEMSQSHSLADQPIRRCKRRDAIVSASAIRTRPLDGEPPMFPINITS